MFMFDLEAFGVVVLLCHLSGMSLREFSDDQSSKLGLVEYCALRAPVDTFCLSNPLPRVFLDHRALPGVFSLRAIVALIALLAHPIEGAGELLLRSRVDVS